MLVRQERLALILLVGVAVAVIAAHLLLAYLGKEPFARHFSETSPDGELVTLNGTIVQITLTKDGGYAVLKVDNISLFTQAQYVRHLGLQKGDRVSVYGVVQTYHGKKELVVNTEDDLLRIPPADDLPVQHGSDG